MQLRQLPQYFRTVRHLHWSQLGWRLRYASEQRFRKLWPVSKCKLPVDLGRNIEIETFPKVPLPTHDRLQRQSLVEALERGEFEHLGERHALVPIDFRGNLTKPNPEKQHIDWRLGVCRKERLWTVTLHYHQWAYALAEVVAYDENDAHIASTLLENYLLDWIEKCDLSVAGSCHLAWNSYAISTRIIWWIRTHLTIGSAWLEKHSLFAEAIRKSLWRQTQYLVSHIEWDIRGNHLLRNGVALAWAARFFQDQQSKSWLRMANRIAISQAEEQVLGDGGHFERSPMYHGVVMHDFLELAFLLDEPAASVMRHTWSQMVDYARWVRHPDGNTPQWNDGAIWNHDDELGHAELLKLDLDSEICRGGKHFVDTGVVVWHDQHWSIFLDVGPIGADVQPSHAHADSLTIDISLNGRRLFVDPGNHSYDLDHRRQYDRSTQAHNTVCIDGIDSSEVWHIFRVGRRATTHLVNVRFGKDEFSAIAQHNGYRHLPGAPIHRREIRVTDDSLLEIVDTIEGGASHLIEGGFLLAPGWQAKPLPNGWELRLKESNAVAHIQVDSTAGLSLAIEPKAIHPDYGIELSTHRLVWRIRDSLPVRIRIGIVGQ